MEQSIKAYMLEIPMCICIYALLKNARAKAKHKINLIWPKLTSVIIFGRKKPIISSSES